MIEDDDHEDHIRIFKCRDNSCGKGNWQCIGYFGDQHISSFGWSPAEALEKAMSEVKPVEEMAWRKYEPAVGPDKQIDLEDMFG